MKINPTGRLLAGVVLAWVGWTGVVCCHAQELSSAGPILRGVLSDPAGEAFSLHFPDERGAFWLKTGESQMGVRVVGYDPIRRELELSDNGDRLVLRLEDARQALGLVEVASVLEARASNSTSFNPRLGNGGDSGGFASVPRGATRTRPPLSAYQLEQRKAARAERLRALTAAEPVAIPGLSGSKTQVRHLNPRITEAK